MKTFLKHIILLLCMALTACTDVIDVDVPETEPRLVVEASLDWEKGSLGNNQIVKLSTSIPYFSNQTNNSVTGASVKVTNTTNNSEFIFTDENDGTYSIANFVPIIGHTYTLEIAYNNQIYTAEETLIPVTDIANLYESTANGFDNEALEVNIDFNDPVNEENYYLFKFQEQGDLLPELLDISDEFTNGNTMTVFFEKGEDEDINQDEFMSGNVVDIKMYGVSKTYYNYIKLLIEQYDSVGDPFSSTPAALRGNCVNTTNVNNYALGYFRLTQVVKASYTFQ